LLICLKKGIEKLIEKQSEKQKPKGTTPEGFDSPQGRNPCNSLHRNSLRKAIIHPMNILTNKTVITRPTNNSAI
jgi:hypothetical protein